MIQTLGAVDPTLCLKIQCGLITQSQAGWQTLLECSQAGYAGVRSALDPVCQQLIGASSPVEVVQEQAYQATHDPQPDDVAYYQPDAETGEPQQWYELPAEPSIDTEAAVTGQPRYDEGATQPAGYEPTPAGSAQPATETQPQDEFDAQAYRQLIGSPEFQFTETRTPGPGAPLSELPRRVIEAAKKLPWWVWVILAAAIWEATRKKR